MKKKIVAFFICMAMATTIVGCASSNTGVTTTTTEAPTITVEKEEAAPAVETPVEEKKTDVAEAEETKEVEVVEEPAKEEEPVEETPAEEEPVEETPAEEEPTEEEKSIAQTLLDGYLADGDFKEAEQYGKDLNADEVYVAADNCICYVFTNWFVQFSTSGDRPNEAYIAIGEWHNKNDATFSHVCDFGEAVAITDSMTVSKEILSYVPTVIDYMTEHPDGNTRPDIPGLNFMACEDHEPFAQH